MYDTSVIIAVSAGKIMYPDLIIITHFLRFVYCILKCRRS